MNTHFGIVRTFYPPFLTLCCVYESVKGYNPFHFSVFFTISVHYWITLYVCFWFIVSEICPVWGLRFTYNCIYLISLLSFHVLVHTWNNIVILNICVCSFRVNIKKYYLILTDELDYSAHERLFNQEPVEYVW